MWTAADCRPAPHAQVMTHSCYCGRKLIVLGLLLRCEVVFVLSPESAAKDSELSALSCLDVTIDSTLQTDARPDMTTFLYVCKESCFLCFENKMAHNGSFLFPHKRTRTHTHTALPLLFWHLCEPFGNSELTTGKEGQSGAALFGHIDH